MKVLPKVLVTGLNGLVGSRLKLDLATQFDFIGLDISDPQQPVDITNQNSVMAAFNKHHDAEFVIHLAAYTDVTGAWKQKDDKTGSAFQVNVNGTKIIAQACQRTHKHLIHVSTAYVFDGNKSELYLESDQTNPIEWYGYTKALAEDRVQQKADHWTILRIDQPFRSDPFVKYDIVRRIALGLKNNSLPPQFTNHTFGPTFLDDFSLIIKWVIQSKTTGLYHSTSGEQWTDYDFASQIANFIKSAAKIEKGDVNQYFKTIDRPYQKNTALNSSFLKERLPFKSRTIKNALELATENLFASDPVAND